MTAASREQSPRAARRARIFMPYVYPATFIEQDRETLSARYDVRVAVVRSPRALPAGIREVVRADLVFCWFGSIRFFPYVLLARLLGKPVVVIAGGYDVASEPSIGYGNMLPGFARFIGRLVFRLSTLTVAVSETSLREARENALVPASKARHIPLGFDVDQPPEPVPADAKQPVVLALGNIDASTIHKKGWLTVARMSKLVPEISVVFAGPAQPEPLAELQAAAGPNVRFTGFVTGAVRDEVFSSAAVYVQPSVHEAFGCSVAESMLFGCVPVVADRAALPEVVGPCGYYVEPNDPEGLANAVRRALSHGAPGPESPRERITRLFPVSLRRTRLYALVDELLAHKTMRTT